MARELAVKFCQCGGSSVYRLLSCCASVFPNNLATDRYPCFPRYLRAILAEIHTLYPDWIAGINCSIEPILRSRGFSEINPPIIALVHIFVVYLFSFLWSSACHPQKRKIMCLMHNVINANSYVPILPDAPRDAPNATLWPTIDLPCEKTCFWIVIQEFAQSFGCDMVGLSHGSISARRMVRGMRAGDDRLSPDNL